jgi:hypothetical protein
MSTNYEPVNLADLYEEAERFDAAAEGGNDYLDNFVLMPEGEGFVNIRLLPPAKGKKFFTATRTHRLGKKNLHCPRELVSVQGKKRWIDTDPKNPCPICKFYNGLWRDSEEAGSKEEADAIQADARKIKPIERYYYNAVVRQQVNKKTGEVEKNVGPKILSIGKTLHERIIRAITGDPKNEEKGLGDVSDLKTGRDFKIVKKLRGVGKEKYPYYEDSKFQDASVLGDKDQIEKWLGSMHELATLRVVKPLSELDVELKKYNNVIPNEDTEFDMDQYRTKPNKTLDEQVKVEVTKAKVEPKAPVGTTANDTALNQEDFFADLDTIPTK